VFISCRLAYRQSSKTPIETQKIKNRKKLLNVSILCEQKDDDDWDGHDVLVT